MKAALVSGMFSHYNTAVTSWAQIGLVIGTGEHGHCPLILVGVQAHGVLFPAASGDTNTTPQ